MYQQIEIKFPSGSRFDPSLGAWFDGEISGSEEVCLQPEEDQAYSFTISNLKYVIALRDYVSSCIFILHFRYP